MGVCPCRIVNENYAMIPASSFVINTGRHTLGTINICNRVAKDTDKFFDFSNWEWVLATYQETHMDTG
jgi:hypothetical protein